MAQFCVNIADEQIQLVINSICALYNYVPLVSNPDPNNHPNPDFNPFAEEGPDNLRSIPQFLPNPNYVAPAEGAELTMEELMALEPEFISNPDWNPPAVIANPENPYQFVNRIVRGWIADNVKAYQAQVASEAARKAALEATQVEITDPYVG